MTGKILVTGVAGFIGSHVAERLIRAGHDVVGVDDLSGGFESNLPKGVRFQALDVADSGAIDRLFEKEQRFDVIFHLAAYAAEGLSHYIRHYNYTNNILGSVNLINHAIRSEADCFVFGSSIAVYGKGPLPLTEDLAPRPIDPYGVAKYAVELDLMAAQEQFGLDYIIFRPHNVYGERQNITDRYRNVVGIFMRQLLAGEPMTIFGDGAQTRAFSFIDDVAPILASAPWTAGARNRVFNIGADEPCTILELGQYVAEALEIEPCFEHVPERKEVVHAYASHAELRSVFGATPLVPIREGLKRMGHWAREFGPGQMREASIRPLGASDELEITRGLPSAWRYLESASTPS